MKSQKIVVLAFVVTSVLSLLQLLSFSPSAAYLEGWNEDFGPGGFQRYDGILGVEGSDELPMSAAIDSNGAIIVGGIMDPYGENPNIFVTRINPSGEIDTTFGTGGVQVYDAVGYEDGLYKVVIDSSGNIYLIGTSCDIEGYYNPIVIKLDSGGNFVDDFGTNGVLLLERNSPTSDGYATSAVVVGGTSGQGDVVSNDSYLLVSVASGGSGWIDKVYSDGTLEHQYMHEGCPMNTGTGIIVDQGYTYFYGHPSTMTMDGHVSVCRFTTSDGLLDESFGNSNGYIEYNPGSGNDYIVRMVIDSDDSLLLLVSMMQPFSVTSEHSLCKLGFDGVEDETFGDYGCMSFNPTIDNKLNVVFFPEGLLKDKFGNLLISTGVDVPAKGGLKSLGLPSSGFSVERVRDLSFAATITATQKFAAINSTGGLDENFFTSGIFEYDDVDWGGGTNGDLVTDDVGNLYFVAEIANRSNEDSDIGIWFFEREYQVANLPEGFSITDGDGNPIEFGDPTGASRSVDVSIDDDQGNPVFKFVHYFTDDIDFSDVFFAVGGGKVFVNGLGTQVGDFQMYIPSGPEDNIIYYCPLATTLDEISETCADVEIIENPADLLAVEEVGGDTYWVITEQRDGGYMSAYFMEQVDPGEEEDPVAEADFSDELADTGTFVLGTIMPLLGVSLVLSRTSRKRV